MKPSPLQLENHFFTRIEVKANPGKFPPEPPKGGLDLHTEIRFGKQAHDPGLWVVQLGVSSHSSRGKRQPYEIEVEALGYFRLAPDIPSNAAPRMLSTNAPAVLYGAIREMVMNLTARGPWLPVRLPTVSFVDQVIGPPEGPTRKRAGARKRALRS